MKPTNHKNMAHYWILNGLSIVLKVGFGGCEAYIWSVRNNLCILVVKYLVRRKLEKRFVSVSVLYTFEICW